MRGSEQKIGCQSVDYKGDGLNVESVMRVGSGGTPGGISEDSETF